MSDRDRKFVWIVGVVTLLAGGFFIGRLFGGDRDAAPPSSGNEIAHSTDDSAPIKTPRRIPIELEKGDEDRLVATSPDPEDRDSVENPKQIEGGFRPPHRSHHKANASADSVPEEGKRKRVPSMGAVEL